MIKWVVFDIGGVLIDLAADRVTARYSELSGLPAEKVQELFQFPQQQSGSVKTFVEQFSLGQISVNRYLDLMQQQLSATVSHEEIVEAELLILGDDKIDTVRLLEELKPQIGVACFSNTHKIHWDNLRATRSWYDNFSHIFASHEEGLAKPDPAVFRFMEKRLQAKPEECVFIDDVEKNARAAESCRWHAIHFKDAAAARAELVRLGAMKM